MTSALLAGLFKVRGCPRDIYATCLGLFIHDAGVAA